jgi:LPXTG-site transpeptidase (sortase) family protein
MRQLSVIVSFLSVALGCAPAAVAGAGSGSVNDPARLLIPKIHLDAPVGLTLDRGPAFYAGSARPGQPYTIAIAGHRTTHTRPFWSLDLLRKGDRIVLVWHHRRHVYTVTGSEVVSPSDWTIARDVGRERLVLSTCTPRFTARSRLVVFANPT